MLQRADWRKVSMMVRKSLSVGSKSLQMLRAPHSNVMTLPKGEISEKVLKSELLLSMRKLESRLMLSWPTHQILHSYTMCHTLS